MLEYNQTSKGVVIMVREIEIEYKKTKHQLNVNQYPNKCGTCNVNIDPLFIVASFVRPHERDKKCIEAVFQCTSNECNSLLIGYYIKNGSIYYYQKTEPMNPVNKTFTEEIKEVSFNFIEIYNQSYRAEQTGLNLISGIGYRKALEFLVKDYLIYLNPDKEQEIMNKMLNPCINMLDNHNLKEIARRASWLGNDEAHYMRKWEDKDISDLKKLIEVTVYHIKMEVTSKKYLNEMT